ncbi:hypothetical protein RI367_007885 [Sorochytrium milnesiophthora]
MSSTAQCAALADQVIALSSRVGGGAPSLSNNPESIAALHNLLNAVRSVRNLVIGNRTRKEQFLHNAEFVKALASFVVPVATGTTTPSAGDVADTSSADRNTYLSLRQEVCVQAAVVIGSLASGKDANATRLALYGAATPLLDCLSLGSQDTCTFADFKLLEAATRAIKAMLTGPRAHRSHTLQEQHIRHLVQLLDVQSLMRRLKPANSSESTPSTVNLHQAAPVLSRIAETAAHIISRLASGMATYEQTSSSSTSPTSSTGFGASLRGKLANLNNSVLSALSPSSHSSADSSRIALMSDSGAGSSTGADSVQHALAKMGVLPKLLVLLYLSSTLPSPASLLEVPTPVVASNGMSTDTLMLGSIRGSQTWSGRSREGTMVLSKPSHTAFAKVSEAALEALAALCRDNTTLSSTVVQSDVMATSDSSTQHPAVTIISSMLRQKSPATRLAAAACLTNIFRIGVGNAQLRNEINTIVLPMLVKLFAVDVDPSLRKDTASGRRDGNADSSQSLLQSLVKEYPVVAADRSLFEPVQEKAPLVFAYLVSESEDMQKAAAEADAIPRLADLLKTIDSMTLGSSSDNASDSLSDSGADCDSSHTVTYNRLKEVIDAKILPNVVLAMSHPSVGVRAAACQCTRSLSRSVKNLRTCLVDAGVAEPLFKLLSDESTNVQVTASATLCNIVLDFSPMKKAFLENGGVEKLVALATSTDNNVRLNAVWALKNLVYNAPSMTKFAVMSKLTYSQLLSLLNDTEVSIQEQALNLLRNLVCGSEEVDVAAVFVGFGEGTLLSMVESKLQSPNTDIAYQALYIVVNMSTGSERHKNAIMDRNVILAWLMQYLSHTKPAMRVATIWCIINLTWPEDTDPRQRVERLRALGFERKLKDMANDSELDVRDRVKAALAQFADLDAGLLLAAVCAQQQTTPQTEFGGQALAVLRNSSIFLVGGYHYDGQGYKFLKQILRINISQPFDFGSEPIAALTPAPLAFAHLHSFVRGNSLNFYSGLLIPDQKPAGNQSDFEVNVRVMTYDLAQNKWSASRPLLHGLTYKMTTASPGIDSSNGTPPKSMYMFGGINSFDPAQHTTASFFRLDASNASLPVLQNLTGTSNDSTAPAPRQFASLVRVNSTTISLSGGFSARGTIMRDQWLYDETTQKWTQAPSLLSPRYFHRTLSYKNRYIIHVGGYTSDERYIMVEYWDMERNQMALGTVLNASHPKALQNITGGQACLIGDQLLLLGGYTLLPGFKDLGNAAPIMSGMGISQNETGALAFEWLSSFTTGHLSFSAAAASSKPLPKLTSQIWFIAVVAVASVSVLVLAFCAVRHCRARSEKHRRLRSGNLKKRSSQADICSFVSPYPHNDRQSIAPPTTAYTFYSSSYATPPKGWSVIGARVQALHHKPATKAGLGYQFMGNYITAGLQLGAPSQIFCTYVNGSWNNPNLPPVFSVPVTSVGVSEADVVAGGVNIELVRGDNEVLTVYASKPGSADKHKICDETGIDLDQGSAVIDVVSPFTPGDYQTISYTPYQESQLHFNSKSSSLYSDPQWTSGGSLPIKATFGEKRVVIEYGNKTVQH